MDNNQNTPEPGTFDRPKSPRVREQKLLVNLVSGQARSVTDAMLKAGINPSSTAIRNRLAPGGDLRAELDKQLIAAGIDLPRILKKLSLKIDATKTISIDKQALSVEDNDAQLRAVDMAIKLTDRAGKLPAEQEASATSTITVNVLVVQDRPEEIVSDGKMRE